MRYAVVIEKGERNYSAHVPDLPGCPCRGRCDQIVTVVLEDTLRSNWLGR